MKRSDIEKRVRRMPWPAPSPELRDRVLSIAVEVAAPITWSDRMWFSRRWRLSALAAVLVAVAVDQFSVASQPAGVSATPYAVAQAQAVDEMAREAGLSPEAAASFARRALSDASRRRTPVQTGPAALLEFEHEMAGGTR
jgi:hypothetical protein